MYVKWFDLNYLKKTRFKYFKTIFNQKDSQFKKLRSRLNDCERK